LATRAQAREAVISLLYAKDVGNSEIGDFIDDILEDKKIRNKQRDFALTLYSGVNENVEQIDSKLDNYLNEWKLDEIGIVERAILRLGAYEILFSDLDRAVIINEAVELSKKLTTDSSPKLINGVLDSIVKAK
jgi:N utilization substance protein B